MKKLFLLIIVFVSTLLFPLASIFAMSNIPNFESDFAKPLVRGAERVYNPKTLGIDSSKSLKENVQAMFYPDSTWTWDWGIIRNIIRTLAAGFLVAMIMYTWIQFIRYPDDPKKIENATNSLIYIGYWAFLVFGSAYLVGLIGFDSAEGSKEIVQNLQNNILINVITFIKGIAFFLAIVMIFWYGFQIIQAMDAADKRKKWITWVINVLSALVFIKLLDFVYYIAQQQDFESRATALFIDISKIIWYLMGALMLLYVIYAGYMLIVSNGNDDAFKKAINTLKTIFIVVLIVFLFLMIIYQLVKDLT